MSKLREALHDKITRFRELRGHPDYTSEIEQNAVIVTLRVLEELDEIAEYEPILLGGRGSVVVMVGTGAQDPPLDEQELAQARSFTEDHRLNCRHLVNELILTDPLLYKIEEIEELESWVFESLRKGWLKPPKLLSPQRHHESVFKLSRNREWKEKKH